MTREEAAKQWEWVIENFNDFSVYLWPDQRQELLASIALLRGPQPDPITGAKDAFSLRMTALRRFIGIRTECTQKGGIKTNP